MPHKDKEKAKEYQKAYREKNREKLLAGMRKYYEENKDKFSEYRKEYYKLNKEEICENAKEYYEKNKEVILEKMCLYHKRYYEENKEILLEKNKQHVKENRSYYTKKQKERRLTRHDWLWELKCGLSCVQCGENHPACLDFHHTDPLQKEGLISKLIIRASMDKVIEEIEKCDILCANCHRKHHYKRAVE